MKTTGKVTGIVSNLVTVEANGPVSQNEICFITVGDTKLMAEVIKVNGKRDRPVSYRKNKESIFQRNFIFQRRNKLQQSVLKKFPDDKRISEENIIVRFTTY